MKDKSIFEEHISDITRQAFERWMGDYVNKLAKHTAKGWMEEHNRVLLREYELHCQDKFHLKGLDSVELEAHISQFLKEREDA